MTRTVVDKSTHHAKPHSIVFYHIIKDNKINLCQDFTDSDLKVHALYYANELLVRVRLSCQKLLQTRSTCRNNAEKMLGKRVMTSTLVGKSTDHDKPHYHYINAKVNSFFQSASWIDVSSVVWTLIDNGKLANQIARLAAIVIKFSYTQVNSAFRALWLVKL